MCTVKTESGLSYKYSQVQVQVQQKWTYISPESSTTSLLFHLANATFCETLFRVLYETLKYYVNE